MTGHRSHVGLRTFVREEFWSSEIPRVELWRPFCDILSRFQIRRMEWKATAAEQFLVRLAVHENMPKYCSTQRKLGESRAKNVNGLTSAAQWRWQCGGKIADKECESSDDQIPGLEIHPRASRSKRYRLGFRRGQRICVQ